MRFNDTRLTEKKQYPGGDVKIQPEALLHAARGKNGGAARLWFLAKHFNQSGSRTIQAREFGRWVRSLGVERRTFEMWLTRALQIQLMTRRGKMLDLNGWARGYIILGCTHAKQQALIPLDKLIGKGWLSWTWARYIKRFENRPISQARLRELTGIPERNQRQYERRAGVIRTRNIALDPSRKADQAAGMREFEHAGAFAYKAGDCVAWNIPSSREVPGVELANNGRSRKIQKLINCLCNNGARDNYSFKIFYKDDQQLKDGLNKAKRLSIKGLTLPDYFYKQTDKARFFEAVRV